MGGGGDRGHQGNVGEGYRGHQGNVCLGGGGYRGHQGNVGEGYVFRRLLRKVDDICFFFCTSPCQQIQGQVVAFGHCYNGQCIKSANLS